LDFFEFFVLYGGNLLRLFAVLAALMLIIFVHELGHYLVGRWCGVGVRVFSIGFGTQIWHWTDRHGTVWRLGVLPLGGYVKFVGDEDALSTPLSSRRNLPENALSRAVAWKRAAISFAGPLFNALYTLVVFSILFFSFGTMRLVPVIGSVLENSPAAIAGFQVGDRFLTMQGEMVDNFRDVALYVSTHEGDEIAFTVERAGEVVALEVVPQLEEVDDGFGNAIHVGRIGITTSSDEGAWQKIDFDSWGALREGASQSIRIVKMTGNFIARIFQGRADRCQLSGPVRSGQIAWRAVDFGFAAFLQLTAFFSLSIGLFNLLPLPPLDGGRLVFELIETVARRPVPQAAQLMFFRIGTFIVLGIVIFAIINNMIPC